MERNTINILSWITDIYSWIIIYSCILDFFALKSGFHNDADCFDLCMFIGVGLFSYIAQNLLADRFGTNGKNIFLAVALIMSAIILLGVQGYENFGSLLRYFGCVILIYLSCLSRQLYENERFFVLKMELLIAFTIIASVVDFWQMGSSVPQPCFLLAILLNFFCITNTQVFHITTREFRLKVFIGIMYGAAFFLSAVWIIFSDKIQVILVILGHKISAFTSSILSQMERFLIFVYMHLNHVHFYPIQYDTLQKNYGEQEFNVTIGVVVVIVLFMLVFTLAVVLLIELFKKWFVDNLVKETADKKSSINKSANMQKRSIINWLKRKKARRTGLKKVLYKMMKICKHTECQMVRSDTPKKFMEKVIREYAPEGTELHQKLNQITIEINKCYYSQNGSYGQFSKKDTNHLFAELRRAIRKKKKENRSRSRA